MASEIIDGKEIIFNSEDQLQAYCFQWFWNNYADHRRMLFHVQQKAKNAIEGARFKAIGVVQGPSDLVFIAPKGVTVFIEMKFEDGKQSKEQVDFEIKLRQREHLYFVVKTFAQFKKLILNFIN